MEELDTIYNHKAPLKRAIIWTGKLDELPDWKVKDNIYVPISTVLDNDDVDPEPTPIEDSEITVYINPECRVKWDSTNKVITIDDSTKITTNTFLLHLEDHTSHNAVVNNVPEKSTNLSYLNVNIWENYLNVDGGKEMKPFTIKAIYDDNSTPHYWKVVYKAGRYFIITGIRTSSSNNERTSSQYVIQKAEVNESGNPGIIYYLQLTDGYNVIS